MDPVLATLARLGLALLFVSAARHKWRDRVRFQGILADYRLLPDALVPPAAVVLPAVELGLAVGLVLPATGAPAAVASLGVLLVYSLAIAINLARGRRDIDCGCGGPGQTLHPWLLLRNAALGLACVSAWVPVASRPLSAVDAVTVGLGLVALALLWLAGAQLASTSRARLEIQEDVPMIPALVVSQVVLLFLVVALAGVVFALARQLGVLHERVAPAGALALSGGPRVGEAAPQVAAASLAGTLAQIGAAREGGVSQLLFFLSPRCPVCKTLLPTVQRLARSHGVRLLCASDGTEDDHAALAREHGLAPEDYFVSTDLGLRYGIAKLPYAVLLDGEGIVRAQGIVNTREHVESLFEAEALGVESIQDYLAASASDVRAEGASA